MNRMEERLVYEEKMDRISELLEEMILDAMMHVLQCIWDRNITFDEASNRHKETDDITF